VHGGDPRRLPGRGLRRDGQVQRVFVVEQRFFEHADQRGAQPRGGRLGQGDAVPADIGIGKHRDHAVGLGQQRGGAAALRADGQAVGTQRIAELAAGARAFARGRGLGAQPLTRRQQENECRHGGQARVERL